MYFYIPTQRYANDKVTRVAGEDFSEWSIYEVNGQRAVCLGDEISFSELIQPKVITPKSINLVFEGVLSSHTLHYIHRFVNHRYTSYHKAMPLRLGDIDQLVKYKKTSRKKKWGEWNIQSWLTYSLDTKKSWQTLIVFPTVRSMYYYLKDTGLMDLSGSVILHGQLHASARAKAFRAIKSWSVHTVYATYSQVFRDRNDVQKILLIDQHARWYKNFQEPRYFLPTNIDKMTELWWCEVVKTGEVIDQ
jgi:hypothetical protein